MIKVNNKIVANWLKIATDLQSQLIASEEDKIKLSTENKRFRDLLEQIQGRILFPFNEAAEATQDEDILRWINAALNPQPEQTT